MPIEGCLRITPQGAERLDRRNEVIHGALAKQVQSGEKWKKEDTAAAIPEPEPAASAARDSRESPIEPDPNPKRRLITKSVQQSSLDSIHTQNKIFARSSAEAVLYAAALRASGSKGIVPLLKDLGYEMKPVLAMPPKHILHRQGIGRLKHIDVAYL